MFINNFPFEYWRGTYWMEELEEQWDWLHRRGFELKRFTKGIMFYWKELDWYENLPNMVTMFPSLAFPDFWIDDSTYIDNEFLVKHVILLPEEKEFRAKGLHNPATVERHNWYTRWWRQAVKLHKTYFVQKAAHRENLQGNQEGMPDLHVVEEGQRGKSTVNNDRLYFLTPGGISVTTWADVKQLEELLMSDDDWELTDE